MDAIRFAMIGYAFMGKAHSHALHDVAAFFDDLPARPLRKVLCGRTASEVERVAARWGWDAWTTDWRQAIERADVDAVIIGTPNHTHHAISLTALAAGKHVLCEKPLATNLAQAEEMAAAAERAGVTTGVAFNYRRVPAVTLARHLIQSGRLGRIYHFRAAFLQDWLLDPAAPMSWRLRKGEAGSGTLGDLVSHSIDLARFLVGEVAEVVADATTFVRERPAGTGRREPVTVDDRAALLARFAGGEVGTFEASRLSAGHKAANTVEVYGERGSVRWHQERLNELEFYAADNPDPTKGPQTILVTERHHPYVQAWWPPGHIIGWEHTFIHQLYDFITAAVRGTPFDPDFASGAACQRVLDAAERSLASRTWERVRAGAGDAG